MGKTLIEVFGYLQAKTDKAILLNEEEDFTGTENWIPVSQIEDADGSTFANSDNGDFIEIEIPEWLAIEKELV